MHACVIESILEEHRVASIEPIERHSIDKILLLKQRRELSFHELVFSRTAGSRARAL